MDLLLPEESQYLHWVPRAELGGYSPLLLSIFTCKVSENQLKLDKQ